MLDLREWLETLESRGALKVIKGFNWDLEIPATAQVMGGGGGGRPALGRPARRRPALEGEGERRTALLFDDVVGYPSGYRVLLNATPNSRLGALYLGVPESDSDVEMNQAVREKLREWEVSLHKFEPKVVKSGPVMENVDSGKNVDLFKFPVLKHHEGDGGRYIGTGGPVITRDADTGQINLGTYRCEVQDKKTITVYAAPGKDGWLHMDKYHKRGEAAPVAVVVGYHPLLMTASVATVQPYAEYNLVGAITGEPVRVIKEEVTGLPIPADAEIVIAGWSPPNKTRKEGPFGEWTGYYTASGPMPYVEIERVYYRNNPILCSGGNWGGRTLGGALLLSHLEKCGVPDVQGVWGDRWWTVVSIKQRYAGHARQALVAAQSFSSVAHFGRFVIVVDEDIDPSNREEVIWAMCSRVDPEKDIDIIRRMWSCPMDMTIHQTNMDFSHNDYSSSRALIDACRPYEWKDEFAKVIEWSPELLERVRKKLQKSK